MPFTFNTLLLDEGLPLSSVRLLRHETDRHGRTPYALWRDDPAGFIKYQRIQRRDMRSWFRSDFWASFVATPQGRTLFVGLFKVVLLGPLPESWVDPLSGHKADHANYELYETIPSEKLVDFAGRLVVDWGAGKRGWRQLAANKDKPVIELHERFVDPPFPGYAAFVANLSEINSLPSAWRTALGAVHGVYLLTCPRTREQYVGSATGSGGLLGRWLGYIADGHGGNVGLRSRDPADYQVSILQVAGSGDDRDSVLAMEAIWKAKLQSREMGLNRN